MAGQSESKTKLALAALAALLALAGCGGGGGDSSSGDAKPLTQNPAAPVPAPVTAAAVSGKITYDFVPAVASKDSQGKWQAKLDYANTMRKPARGIVVELVDTQNKVLLSTQTDELGAYVFQAPANTVVRIRAKAQALRAAGSGPSWNFAVRDNSSGGYGVSVNGAALYAIEGTSFNSGVQASVHDLNAGSGWGGSSYTTARAAAPFAMLDTVYTASQKVLLADKNLVFPPLNVFWSPDSADGTYYGNDKGPATKGLHILGQENVDTDEYDAGVIAHEWGHYFQASFSRDDSIGGGHGSGDLLDMRLAFSEGWGNAFSSMARDDPMYVDTSGPQQGRRAVVFKVDEIPASDPKAWFSETAIQSVLYRLYSAPDVGFAPIYQAMTMQRNSAALTSMHSFATYLRGQIRPAGQTIVDTLLAEINMANKNGLDMFGAGQIALPPSVPMANLQFVLPIYTPLAPGQAATVCTTASYGSSNKLGVYRYLRFNIGQTGVHQLKIVADPGLLPSVDVYSYGNEVSGLLQKDPATSDSYTGSYGLAAHNDYVATIASDDNSKSGCFSVTLVP
ncbi:hypothetical protein CAter282_2075 [Collimonas arenae]|uniref:Lipoprotein n=1 Tax=Collimonas arenae TaxID=279058 RepID=A0A127PQ70_9BURK|nr:hypothetical protein [Collimonas arenae]AMO99937.1 hypothetical protein CAter10_2254 [Collimonas arenae]AMP09833.1 hypothetical protein CAter282_2075 [Collimonas arenae]